jgi:ABC-type transport system involved in multi-copper enzyme maturation permease subunit
MKPYIAILIDSFWEAVGNRILWALLVGWGLVLCGLAPFGYVSERSYTLFSADINNLEQLKKKINTAAQGQGPASIKAVVSKMDSEFLERIKESEISGQSIRRPIRASEMAKALNAALPAKDLYNEDSFPTASKRLKTIEPLLEKGKNLSDAELEELNRRLLQLAFPTELNQPRGEKLWIGYAGFKLGEPINISRRQIRQFVEPLLLQLIIKLGLGVVAVFVALIVTSPMIPDTFKSGSLHLLLSKPISRVGLYLFKFFGGCVFVLFNITFLLVGLYFIAGIRFEIWNEGLLACIPLLLFVFIIFYSISALVGLIWGNAIICVVSCIVFWLFCFAIGAIHDGMSQHVELFPQISRIDQIDGKLLVVNQRGDFNIWNDQYSVWQPALDNDAGGQGRTFGPIFDPDRNQIVIKTFNRMSFGPPVARNRQLDIVRLNELKESEQDARSEASPKESTDQDKAKEKEASDGKNPKNITEARTKAYWTSDLGPEIPAQLIELTQIDGDVIAACRGGLFRLNWDKDLTGKAGGGIANMLQRWMPTTKAFENVAPKDFVTTDNSTAAATADGHGLILYNSGTLDLLSYENKKFTVTHSTKLEGEESAAALVAANHAFVVVARDSMPVVIMDSSLKPVHSAVVLPNKSNPRQLAWIPDSNELSIITHTGDWLRLDCQSGQVASFASPFAGRCTAMKWQGKDRVWLGIKPNKVVEYQLGNKVIKEYAPKASTLELVYNWIIHPLYFVNPKPSALDNTMNYLLSGNQTQSMNLVTNDLKQAQIELDVRGPLVSNLIFVGVILLVSSIYLARKEF